MQGELFLVFIYFFSEILTVTSSASTWRKLTNDNKRWYQRKHTQVNPREYVLIPQRCSWFHVRQKVSVSFGNVPISFVMNTWMFSRAKKRQIIPAIIQAFLLVSSALTLKKQNETACVFADKNKIVALRWKRHHLFLALFCCCVVWNCPIFGHLTRVGSHLWGLTMTIRRSTVTQTKHQDDT